MTHLVEDMQTKNRTEILNIEAKNNCTIEEELTAKHVKKYKDIHGYYKDISCLKIDMINTLRTDFKREKIREATANRKKMMKHTTR